MRKTRSYLALNSSICGIGVVRSAKATAVAVLDFTWVTVALLTEKRSTRTIFDVSVIFDYGQLNQGMMMVVFSR